MSATQHSVYAIANKDTGQTYFGLSMQPAKRRRLHFNSLSRGDHHSAHLQRAYTKHGPERFEWFLVDTFDTIEECEQAEALYVAWFKSIGMSYNSRDGGGSKASPSLESRQKASRSLKGRTVSPETREKIAAALRGRPGATKGYKHSEETRRKASAVKTGKPNLKARGQKRTLESRRKMSAARGGKPSWNTGVPMRLETKAKLAHTFIKPGTEPWNKGKTEIYSQEMLDKNREWHTGRIPSEETRRRMSEGQQAARKRRKEKTIGINGHNSI